MAASSCCVSVLFLCVEIAFFCLSFLLIFVCFFARCDYARVCLCGRFRPWFFLTFQCQWFDNGDREFVLYFCTCFCDDLVFFCLSFLLIFMCVFLWCLFSLECVFAVGLTLVFHRGFSLCIQCPCVSTISDHMCSF